MNYQTATLGEIATQIPGSTQVFRKYKLDFCCTGNRTISEAIQGSNLDANTIIEDIQQVKPNPKDPKVSEFSSVELIEYILKAYHEKHRRDIPELIQMALKVENVHSEKSNCPIGLANHLNKISNELEEHMLKEELIVFPAIQMKAGEMLQNPIDEIEAEHKEHGANLEELERLTNNYNIPEEACNTWRALLLGVKNLAEELTEHIHLENNILLPKAKQDNLNLQNTKEMA